METTARAGERAKAALYDRLGRSLEAGWGGETRRRILAHAHGRVLEVGAGTGANLAHYPRTVTGLVLTEPGAGMLARAQRRAAESGLEPVVVRAPAEALPFEDSSFDTVVGTLVFCTVPDPAAALGEVIRVLRPGGRLVFIEHIRSDDPRRRRWQGRLVRPWRVVADGCHPNRDTLATIEAAGFSVAHLERGDIPRVPPIVRPYVAGWALAPGSRPR